MYSSSVPGPLRAVALEGRFDPHREKGPRMAWQFRMDDGSMVVTFSTKKGFKMANEMMKARGL